jgi:DnaJ-class molecular chaperone
VEEGHEDQGRDLLHTITPDLVFIIDDKSHKVFTRYGNYLVTMHTHKAKDFLCGYVISPFG